MEKSWEWDYFKEIIALNKSREYFIFWPMASGAQWAVTQLGDGVEMKMIS